MGISLALLLGGAGLVLGQGAPLASDKPSSAAWQKYPQANAPALPKPTSAAQQLPEGGPRSRVLMYQKPANEIRPVQATDKPMPAVEALPKDTKGPKVPPSANLVDQAPRNPFMLMNDDDLTEYTLRYIDDNANADYRDEMERYRKGNLSKEPLKPKKTGKSELLLFKPDIPLAMPKMKPNYEPMVATLEPGYVVHRRLYFEDKNSERYGWDLGMFQPALSATIFYKDVLFWPHKLASNPMAQFDTSAGLCPPGSPVPYYLYPPELTLGGSLLGTAAVLGTIFLLP